MKKFTVLKGRVLSLPRENIDTDQIIPASFLKVTDKAGLGEHLFHGWRYRPDGSPDPDFVLNRPGAKEAPILAAGDNFGCGSSREHAPWALLGFGFRAVVSTSFADIFRNNALKNGLLPVEVDRETLEEIHRLAREEPGAEVTIDLPAQEVVLPGGRKSPFPIDSFSKKCLVEGIDQLGYLMKHIERIEAYERTHPARVDTAGLEGR